MSAPYLMRGAVAALVLSLGAAAAPLRAMPSHADVPGIAWFQGDVADAFVFARAAKRPLLNSKKSSDLLWS